MGKIIEGHKEFCAEGIPNYLVSLANTPNSNGKLTKIFEEYNFFYQTISFHQKYFFTNSIRKFLLHNCYRDVLLPLGKRVQNPITPLSLLLD